MQDITHVSFPGLGIGDLELNKIAFTLFDKLEVRWYGIILTMGIVLAFLYTVWRGKRNEGIKSDDVIDVGIVTVLCGIIGARAYYVLTTLDTHHYDSFIDVIAVWNGGIAVYGSIIGGALGIVAVCAFKRLSWRKLFDMVSPGLIIAQSLGRWGNFFNGEAHGSVIGEFTELDLFGNVLQLPSGEGSFFHTFRMGLVDIGGWQYYHPTFLYESVWNLLGFILLNIFYKRKRFDGQIALMYFTWYGLGRMFIEGFRTDSLYVPGTNIRISQLVGLACVIVAGALLTVFLIRSRRNRPVTDTVPAEGELEANASPEWTKKLGAWWSRAVSSVRAVFSKKEDAENPDEPTEPNTPEAPTQTEEPITQEDDKDGNEN